MTNEEIFRSQWLRVKEEIVEKMNHAIARGEKLSYRDLNKLYKSKMLRWEGCARPEGRWLEGLTNDAQRQVFLKKLRSVSLEEIPEEPATGRAPIVSGAIGGGIAAAVMLAEACLLGAAGLGWFIRSVCILSCFVLAFSVANKKAQKESRRREQLLKKLYIAQIENTGKELEAYWREV